MVRDFARGARALPVLLLGLVAVGCGGGEDAAPPAASATRPRPAAQSGPNQPPVIQSVRLEPSRLLPGHPVRAEVQATDPDGDKIHFRYAWQRNGSVLGDATAEITPRDAAKGDEITLTVIASDGRDDSAPVSQSERIANRPPVLFAVGLESADAIVPGRPLVASPSADDPDGDEMTFEYAWRVNGESLDVSGPELPTEDLKRGDRVEVEVVASDGDDASEPKTSAPVSVGNTPPRILSDAQWKNVAGEMQYSVEAEDPDGDRSLRFRLLKAPDHMQIDPIRGDIRWRPTAAQKGKHPVEIEVDDLRGGKTVQRFEMSVDVEEAVAAAEPTPIPPQPDEDAAAEDADADTEETSAGEGDEAQAAAPPAPSRRQRTAAPAARDANAEDDTDADAEAATDQPAEE
jgi:hypothetical protein